MLIGNLGETASAEDDDYLIVSKDNVHLNKIKKKNLTRGGSGRGLKFWLEDEKYFKRYINETSKYEHNGYFEVPGEAEMVVATRGLTRYGSSNYHTGMYMDKENSGYYILRRTSSTPVIGGIVNYREWGEASSRLTDTIGVENSRHDFGLPGWCLLSPNKNDLTYEFIFKDLDGNEEVLEIVTALNTTYTIAGLDFYVNGYVTPSIYEPLFIDFDATNNRYVFKTHEYDTSGSMSQMDRLIPSNSAYYYERQPDKLYFGGYYVDMSLGTTGTGYPERDFTSKQFDNSWPRRAAWNELYVGEYVTDPDDPQGIHTIFQSYWKLKDLQVDTIEFTLGQVTVPTTPGGDIYNPVKGLLTDVVYKLPSHYDYELGQQTSQNPPTYEHTPPRWLAVEYGEPDVFFNNLQSKWYARYSIPGYPSAASEELTVATAYNIATHHTKMAYLGSVYGITGIPYDTPAESPTVTHDKDAIHFIEHDSGIVSLGHALTYLGCYPKNGEIAFAAGYMDESAGEPVPESLNAMIFNDGKYYGTDYYIKMGDEYVSVREIKPPGVGMNIVGSSIPTSETGVDGDLYFRISNGKTFKYIRFEIYGQKGSNSYTQLAEMNFRHVVGTSESSYDFTGAIIKSNIQSPSKEQNAFCLIDGFTTSVALWKYQPTSQNRIILTIKLDTPLDISYYNNYQLYTAADAPARDPNSWELKVSNDGYSWFLLDDQYNYRMTDDRTAIGYSKWFESEIEELDQNPEYFIYEKYIKKDGIWLPIY